MQWPGWGVWVRKGCGCLACTGENKDWRHSWCFREDLSRWLEVVVSPEVEKRRGEVRPVEEKKYLGSKMIFYKLCTRPPPPLPKTMKCKSIYTGWKRDILFFNGIKSWLLIQL
jgi:hypothetical protein